MVEQLFPQGTARSRIHTKPDNQFCWFCVFGWSIKILTDNRQDGETNVFFNNIMHYCVAVEY